jgi:adenine/guanine phosphoribosyltransferase-like PRPP-binding protein
MSTEGFWQQFEVAPSASIPPLGRRVSAEVAPERWLDLPIRVLPGAGDRAVASIIINHASFDVVDWFADAMAAAVRDLRPEVVVGLPTLGLALAPQVARRLGFPNFVAMGYSRKFWYDDALSEDVSSVTTPDQQKRLYVDPNLAPRLTGRRVLIVDDVVSRGTTVAAARRLLDKLDVAHTSAVVIMAQTDRWRPVLAGFDLRYLFATPMFERRPDGWWPV